MSYQDTGVGFLSPGSDRCGHGCEIWCVLRPPSVLRPQSLILSIYVLTGLVMLVTQPVIVVSPVLVESRKLRLAAR